MRSRRILDFRPSNKTEQSRTYRVVWVMGTVDERKRRNSRYRDLGILIFCAKCGPVRIRGIPLGSATYAKPDKSWRRCGHHAPYYSLELKACSSALLKQPQRREVQPRLTLHMYSSGMNEHLGSTLAPTFGR